jgi:predicted 2-oxoglutarate/Fe(II)-dependent dioxygenase YbiX
MTINAIKDFISPEGVIFLNNYFRTINPDIRNKIGFHWGTTDTNNLNINQAIVASSMSKAIHDIQSLMEIHYSLKLKLKRCLVQTVYEGGDIGKHFDDWAAEQEEGFAQNIYPAVFYLSNDYTGGELVFTNLDITLRPEPGTLVFFPGTEEFEHEVKPVLSGERTSMTLFFNNI